MRIRRRETRERIKSARRKNILIKKAGARGQEKIPRIARRNNYK